MIALLALAYATEPQLPGEAVLTAELARSQAELSLPDAPPLYHLRYKLLHLDQADIEASLGGLVRVNVSPYDALFVEVRLGTPQFDNTGFGGWQTGFRSGALPERWTDQSLASVAWRATDRAYKEGVEQYARKAAQFTPPPDYPGDYTLAAGVHDDLGTGAVGDATALQDLARRLSAAMAVDPPTGTFVERGHVQVGHEGGSFVLIDTEGTRLRFPLQETTIRAAFAVRAPDGMLLTDQRLWTVKRPEDLPPADDMVASVAEMTDALLALAAAPALESEYVGPVLFEEGAALDLFRYLLSGQLEGTPPDVPFDSWFGEMGGFASSTVRMQRRVLPPGWGVVDDPQGTKEHPSYLVYDTEGSEAKRVELVSDGIVQDLLMSRVPRTDLKQTNGHARGLSGRPAARPTQLAVTPDKHASERALRKKALKMAAAYKRDWVVVVRRLQEPSVLALDGRYFGGDDVTLPQPVEIVRLYADGREEVLRGAQFAGVQRFVLRDIVAAGEQVTGSYLADSRGETWAYGLTEGLPTLLSAPEVLVGEMELVPAPGDPKKLPVVPPPVMAHK